MRRKLKICSPQLGISPASELGGEVYDYQTLKGFTEKGFEVYVYIPKGRDYDRSLKNFYVERCFLKHIVPPIIYSFLCLPYLFRLYKKERFEVLRIHSPRFLGLAAIIFHFFRPRVPIVASYVTSDKSLAYFFIEKKLFQISSRIIVQSQYMKKRLISIYGVSSKKVFVTYGGYLNPTKKWSEMPQAAKSLKNSDRVLLFMGLLIKRKNPAFALEVFSKVKSKISNAKIVFIGHGGEQNTLKKRARLLNLDDSVIFVDLAYSSEKAYWLSRMDVFVLPSTSEGFGLAVTEAMSFSKPVIVSNIEPFREIIKDGFDGYLVELNEQKWTKTIVALLENERLMKITGKNARTKVETKFNWEHTYESNKKAIQSIFQ